MNATQVKTLNNDYLAKYISLFVEPYIRQSYECILATPLTKIITLQVIICMHHSYALASVLTEIQNTQYFNYCPLMSQHSYKESRRHWPCLLYLSSASF